MRYYAQYNDSGALLAIGTGAGGVEITESEYNSLLSEIRVVVYCSTGQKRLQGCPPSEALFLLSPPCKRKSLVVKLLSLYICE